MPRRSRLLVLISSLVLAVTVAFAPGAGGAVPGDAGAQASKKGCKKAKKRAAAIAKKKKCKKKPSAPVPGTPPAAGSGPPPPPPPDTRTTEQKIDDAIASGEITPEQGLTYKVFAGFGDPRLPSQYVGAPDPLTHPPLDDVTAQWDQLSDGAKATLGPFLIPPMHEGSYWQQLISGATPSATRSAALASPRAAAADPDSPWCATSGDVALEDWHFLEAISGPAGGKVRIWYQDRYAATDSALAGNLLNAMQSKIWPSLSTLMGREPLPDFGSTGVCAGGSDAVDIALVDAAHATTTPTLRQENTPAHMVFPRAGSGSTPPYLAHEFMHMIQYAFTFSSGDMSSGENQWLKEGTAQWVQDYVSSSQYGIGLTPNQTEQQALQYFFPYPEKSLDSTTPNHHDYGSYVFWLWAARKGNNASIVRQAWDAVASQKSLNAAKSAFGSGWAQAWKDFTKANWNKDPVTDYQGWDSITNTPAVAAEGTLPNASSAQTVVVAPVAAKYLTFKPADDVNVLTYRNVAPLSDEAGVQAIITYQDGSKATEDWTQIAQQDVPFCNIEELTLVFSNAAVTAGDSKVFPISWTPPSPGSAREPAIGPRAANVCVPNPQGTFSGTAHYDDTVADVLDWTWSGNVVFEANGQANAWFDEFFDEVWDNATVKSGSVTMSASGTVTGSEQTCEIDIPAQNFTLGPGDGSSMIIQPGPQPHYGIQLFGPPFIEGNLSCPDGTSGTGSFPAPSLIYTPDAEQTLTRGSYAGTATFGNEFFAVNFNWNLTDPQPAP